MGVKFLGKRLWATRDREATFFIVQDFCKSDASDKGAYWSCQTQVIALWYMILLANFFSNSYEPGWKPVWANRSSVGHPQDASKFILRTNVAQKYISNFKFMSQASSLWVFQTCNIFLTLDHHCCCNPPLLTFLHTPLIHRYASVGDLWATCSTVYIGYTSHQL